MYEGEREFDRIAIAGAPEGQEPEEMCAPCGVCRQVMMEFCQPDSFRIILSDGKGSVADFALGELLPYGFGPANLGK